MPEPTQRRIWDISAPVREGSPVFPGDTPYGQTWTLTLGAGSPVNLSTLTMSPHVGTHGDAPLHYSNSGQPMGEVDLGAYLGPCRVIHAIGARPLVTVDHLRHALDSSLPPRVLVRTYDTVPSTWDPEFAGFAPDALDHLATLGVRLVGIDSASADPATSKHLEAHQVLLAHDLRVLENLVLDEVPEGDYELIALPLRFMTADGSPIRAILREI